MCTRAHTETEGQTSTRGRGSEASIYLPRGFPINMKSKVSKNKARRVSCSQTFSSSMPHRADVSLLWQSRSAGSVVGTLDFCLLYLLPNGLHVVSEPSLTTVLACFTVLASYHCSGSQLCFQCCCWVLFKIKSTTIHRSLKLV